MEIVFWLLIPFILAYLASVVINYGHLNDSMNHGNIISFGINLLELVGPYCAGVIVLGLYGKELYFKVFLVGVIFALLILSGFGLLPDWFIKFFEWS